MTENICKGFLASGIAAGIKKNGGKDLGLIFSEVPANVAAVFTQNKVQAAPVVLDRRRVQAGVCRAVIVNSGNANCCTGEQGMQDAVAMAGQAAAGLGVEEEQVLVASTGVIGQLLPMDNISAAIPKLKNQLRMDGFDDFAEAILTTDTTTKLVTVKGAIEGKSFTITGIAKGSGMIAPDMATLLAFICTDVQASSRILKTALKAAVDRSLNRITVDGDTSTNDTTIIMANGCSDAKIETKTQQQVFQKALDAVLVQLARQLVKDAEGATKVVEIIVRNALSNKDAFAVADTVANSNLVKTALFGEDANWGRILAAAGRAQASFDPEQADIFFDDIQMVRGGTGCGAKAESAVADVLKKDAFTISIDLKIGRAEAWALTCDFSLDYVRINADYRS